MLHKLFQARGLNVTLLSLLAITGPQTFGQEHGSDRRAPAASQTQTAPHLVSMVDDSRPGDERAARAQSAHPAGEAVAEKGVAGPALEDEHPAEQTADAAPEPLRQRIIDPRQIRTEDSLPARIMLTPFRFLAPRINSGLTRLENQRGMGRLALILSNPSIRPTFGGLGDGAGFGAGVYLSTANHLSESYKLFFSAHGTTKSYVETLAGAELTPKSFAGGRARIDLVARYRLRPRENFWGLGTDSSRDDRATYSLNERGVRAESSLRIAPALRVGASVDYSSSTATDGRGKRFAGVSEQFGSAGLPGFRTTAVTLLGAGLFAEYEGRDEPANPHSGFYARFAATSNDSIGRGDYGFVNYALDARGYVPLGTKRRTLALRLLGDFNDAKGGSSVPFFRLARLGDGETLRGYDTHRFHGRNAVHGTIEYRYQLASNFEPGGLGGIEAVAFTDAGQVFNSRREFGMKNLRATWGGGLQFSSKRSTLFRVLYARSPEGSRVMLSFGPSF